MSVIEAGISTELIAEVEALIQQGQALAEREQFDRALGVLEGAVAIVPRHEEVIKIYRKTLSTYAKGLQKQRKTQKAYAVLDRALQVLPNNETLLCLYGTMCRKPHFAIQKP